MWLRAAVCTRYCPSAFTLRPSLALRRHRYCTAPAQRSAVVQQVSSAPHVASCTCLVVAVCDCIFFFFHLRGTLPLPTHRCTQTCSCSCTDESKSRALSSSRGVTLAWAWFVLPRTSPTDRGFFYFYFLFFVPFVFALHRPKLLSFGLCLARTAAQALFSFVVLLFSQHHQHARWCSRGRCTLRQVTALHLASLGFHVYAGCYLPDSDKMLKQRCKVRPQPASRLAPSPARPPVCVCARVWALRRSSRADVCSEACLSRGANITTAARPLPPTCGHHTWACTRHAHRRRAVPCWL